MLFFLILPRRPPWTTLFPYTTLFRSVPEAGSVPGDFGGPAQHGRGSSLGRFAQAHGDGVATGSLHPSDLGDDRSEEHTSELQSRGHLVCRLLLAKKKYERTDKRLKYS